MPAFVIERLRSGRALAVLLVIATAAVTSVAGLHAHGGFGGESGGDAPSVSVSCAICALSHAPAVPSLAAVGIATAEPVQEPVSDGADQPHALVVESTSPGRAPPAV